MATETCGCDSCGGESTDDSTGATRKDRPSLDERWLGGDDPLAAPLPADVRAGMERLLPGESVATLADWVDALRRVAADGGPIGVDDLCHADGETPHRGTLHGETHHFQCFFDAVALAELADAPVDIRTESPGGTVVEARASGDGDLSVTPDDAVVSFGARRDVDPSDGDPTLGDAYATICPAVKAFPDRAAYERWAADTPAATVAMPLSAGLGVARALTG